MDGNTREQSNGHLSPSTGLLPEPIGWLMLQTAGRGGHPVPLRHRTNVIGRSTNCDVRIALSSVGRRHCEIVQDGTFVTAHTLGQNTTLCNGRPVKREILNEGDVLTIGPAELIFQRTRAGTLESDMPGGPVAAEPEPPVVHIEPATTPQQSRGS